MFFILKLMFFYNYGAMYPLHSTWMWSDWRIKDQKQRRSKMMNMEAVKDEHGKLSSRPLYRFSWFYILYTKILADFTRFLLHLSTVIYYPCRLCRLAWVESSGRLFVCLFVCLPVCPRHNSKMNDPKVFNILKLTWFWGWKVKGQGHKVNNCIFHTSDCYAYVNANLTDNSNT